MSQPVLTQKASNALKLGKNGSYSNEGVVQQHTLYDSSFTAATLRATTSFFTVPQGGAKTQTETNLSDSGKLPNGQSFLIEKIGFALKANVVGDAVLTNVNAILSAYFNIMQNSIFEIQIASRDFELQIPGSMFLSPIPVAGNSTMLAATDRLVNQGEIMSGGWYKLGVTPISIGNLVSFKVIMHSGSGNGTLAAILNTASGLLLTQLAQIECRLGGILTKMI